MDPRILSEAGVEVWVSIYGFPNYQVSNLGRVRGGKLSCCLKPRDRKSGNKTYVGFTLYTELGPKNVLLSRIMLQSFDGPAPINKPFACHINDDERNNRLHNLRWGSRIDNAQDALRNGWQTPNKGMQSPQSKLTDTEVAEIKSRLSYGESQQILASEYYISQATISRINTGVTRGDI